MGGTSPGDAWDALAERTEDLSPYNPREISNLEINFKLIYSSKWLVLLKMTSGEIPEAFFYY